MNSYVIGIAAAVAAGLAFNAGILIQKSAVGRIRNDARLMRSLLRNPVWLAGFAVQFFIGVPLNAAAVGLIGPALVPGLMSAGLAVIAFGAVRYQKERISWKETTGIGAIMLGVIALSLSGLSIRVADYSVRDPGLASRSGIFLAVLVVAASGCLVAATTAASGGKKGVLYAVGIGLLMNLTNFALGFLTGGLARSVGGKTDPFEIAVSAVSLVAAVSGSASAVYFMQYALKYGRAVIVVPLLNAVAQLLPIGLFFFVYRPYVPDAGSILFLVAAGALLLSGMLLLGGKLSRENG